MKCSFSRKLLSASTKYVSLGHLTETKPNLMDRFIGTDTAIVEIFFNIFTPEIEIFVIPWDKLLYPMSKKSTGWDCDHYDTHLCSLSF